MVQLRAFWINAALLMVKPVLHSICNDRFKLDFPSADLRNDSTIRNAHLEALSRTLQGIAPWLELQQDPEAVELAPIARCAIIKATDPNSTQYMAFSPGEQAVDAHRRQPLVEGAILAHAMLRAPVELFAKLDARAQANVVAALKLTRAIQPYPNNWVLFASMVETFMYTHGEKPDEERLLRGLQLHKEWYLGGSWWGDGPEFAYNYYNSFVIQPMLYDILSALRAHHPGKTLTQAFHHREEARGLGELERHVTDALPHTAAILESLIHPDGSFPAVGRSIVYRCAAFHALSLAALKHVLPGRAPPGQVRLALTRVVNRTLGAHAFDKNGWLTIGVIGSQPQLAQFYTDQGSVYQAAAVFLPLGLPANDGFWVDPDQPTTHEKVWGSL